MKDWYSSLENRYKTFPKDVQVLNVVSDLQKSARIADLDAATARNHLFRALILLQYMADDPKWRNQLKELLRLKTCVAAALTDEPYGTLAQTIQAALGLSPAAFRRMQGMEQG